MSVAERPAARSFAAPIWMLACVTAASTLAMHIFVPALTIAGADLHASARTMQSTIGFYVMGMACGQPIYGPLADHFGRRPMLLCGIGLYTVAGIAAALAPSAGWLITARLFQALGGCAGMVLSRAIIRDATEPHLASSRLALLSLMVTIGPAGAPLIGGLVALAFGWRWIFVALALLGTVNFFFVWRKLAETHVRKEGQGARGLLRQYRDLMRSPVFLCFAIGGGCATTSLYGFVTAAPFIFVEQLHRPVSEVGPYMTFAILGMLGGSLVTNRYAMRVTAHFALIGGSLLGLAAAACFLALSLAGMLTMPSFILCMLLFNFSTAISGPAALTEAMGVNPQVVGSASGLYGALQMGIGALSITLTGLGTNHAVSAGLVATGACVIAQLCFWLVNRLLAGRASVA